MKIEPATVAQVTRSRNGRMVVVDDDVQGVARDLHEINPNLHLKWSEAQGHFTVYYDDGDEAYLVLTAQDLDPRIVARIREITSDGYDYAAEIAKQDAAAEKAIDDRFTEQIGEAAEKLEHALRRDLGLRSQF